MLAGSAKYSLVETETTRLLSIAGARPFFTRLSTSAGKSGSAARSGGGGYSSLQRQICATLGATVGGDDAISHCA